MLGALLVSNALAVHDEDFQLDGDVIASTTTEVPDGNTQTVDWDSLFDVSSIGVVSEKDPLPADFTATSFDKDFSLTANGSFSNADNDIYTTGSKDTQPISQGQQHWQCKSTNNVTDKNDIMNAYATSYDPAGAGDFLYFALEKYDDSGTNDVGFWFLQDDIANCPPGGGTKDFLGTHTDGDLLVVSEFTNGGVVSTINVYRWDDPDGDGPNLGSLNTTTPVAEGADCGTEGTGDDACAEVNAPDDGPNEDGTIETPWPTANKDFGPTGPPSTENPKGLLQTGQFFEGGIKLTGDLAGKCFNTFLANTRASASPGSDLEDFSRGSLGGCTSTTVTTPVQSDGTSTIPATGLDIPADGNDAKIEVKDKALITVTGVDPFDGTVTFHLCGPFAASSTILCDKSDDNDPTTDTGGVLVSSEDITTNGTVTSDAATVTSAGRYCWRADFTSETDGVPDSSDSRSSECFKVNPRKPTLTTVAGAGPVDFGQPVTDTATLANTAHKPGTGGPTGSNGSINPTTLGGDATGTITFTLFKQNADGTCGAQATGTGTNPQFVTTVSGDGTYGPVSFTPDAPGTYVWVASYGGDLPNTLASDASACNDANEDVVVRRINTAISTAQSAFPNDSATISSTVAGKALPSGGTVVFRLYGPTTGPTATALANCSAHGTTGLLYTKTRNSVGGAETVTTSTDNTSVSVNISETYYWRVTYDPGDAAFIGRQSDCVENTVLTFNNDPGTGTEFPPPGP